MTKCKRCGCKYGNFIALPDGTFICFTNCKPKQSVLDKPVPSPYDCNVSQGDLKGEGDE